MIIITKIIIMLLGLIIQFINHMPLHSIIQFIGILNQPRPSETSILKFIINLRYKYKHELVEFLDFVWLQLICNNLGIAKQRNEEIIYRLIKKIILQAQFNVNVMIYCRFLPLLKLLRQNDRRIVEKMLYPKFKEYVKYTGVVNTKFKNQFKEQFINLRQLFQFLESKNFFNFYFNLMNNPQSFQEQITFYFSQLKNENIPESLLNPKEIKILQNNLYEQTRKMIKQQVKQDEISPIYSVISKIVEEIMKSDNILLQKLDVTFLERIIQLKNLFIGTVIIQIIDSKHKDINNTVFLLEFIQFMLIHGIKEIAIQVVFFLIPNIFVTFISKTKEISSNDKNTIIQHFYLWNKICLKRYISTKLLNHLLQELQIFYNKMNLNLEQTCREILQSYGKEFLKIPKEQKNDYLEFLIGQIEQKKMETIEKVVNNYYTSTVSKNIMNSSLSVSKSSQLEFAHELSSFKLNQSSLKSLCKSIQNKYSHNNKQQSSSKQQSGNEHLENIMNLLQLFKYGGQGLSSKHSDSNINSSKSSRFWNELPLQTTVKLSFNNSQEDMNNHSYRVLHPQKKTQLLSHEIIRIKQQKINFYNLKQEVKKKIIKNRGLIIKNDIYQIGYIVCNRQNTKILRLYITFHQFVSKCSLQIKENSLKFRQKFNYTYEKTPKKGHQDVFEIPLNKIKLYEYQNIKSSQKYLKNVLHINVVYQSKIISQKHQLPIYIYNLVQWLPISQNQLAFFQIQPTYSTIWYPAIQKFIKNRHEYIKTLFPLHLIDKNNHYQLKMNLFSEDIYAVIIVLLQQIKVQLINSYNKESIICLLQMLGKTEMT